jgi:hypothetical protein
LTLHQNLKIRQIRLSTFWFYLWCQKFSERRKSNICWRLTFFSTKWFSTFWKYFQRSDLFDFRSFDQINETFNVLTFPRSDFWRSDPLLNKYTVLVGWIRIINLCFDNKSIRKNFNGFFYSRLCKVWSTFKQSCKEIKKVQFVWIGQKTQKPKTSQKSVTTKHQNKKLHQNVTSKQQRSVK